MTAPGAPHSAATISAAFSWAYKQGAVPRTRIESLTSQVIDSPGLDLVHVLPLRLLICAHRSPSGALASANERRE